MLPCNLRRVVIGQLCPPHLLNQILTSHSGSPASSPFRSLSQGDRDGWIISAYSDCISKSTDGEEEADARTIDTLYVYYLLCMGPTGNVHTFCKTIRISGAVGDSSYYQSYIELLEELFAELSQEPSYTHCQI